MVLEPEVLEPEVLEPEVMDPEVVELCVAAGAAAGAEAGALGVLSPPVDGDFFSVAEDSLLESDDPSEAGSLLLLA